METQGQFEVGQASIMGIVDPNRHGLSRRLSEPLKRQIRKACGFGCVVCGLAVCVYEHIDPLFAEATSHNPESMALLCGSCHDKVTRHVWSKDKIAKARRNPKTFLKGYSQEALDLTAPLDLRLGSSVVRDVKCIVRTNNGDEWFVVHPPEEPGGPARITVKFYGPDGKPELSIVKNELQCRSDVWDFEFVGPTMTLRRGPRRIGLRLHAIPPRCLHLERLEMITNKHGIRIDPQGKATFLLGEAEITVSSSQLNASEAVFSIP